MPTVGPDDVGVFVSQSGETKDVLNALYAARQRGLIALGLVNVIGSTLMKESEIALPMACGYEISVPATKTFTNQVLAFLYLALRLGNHSTSELARLPELIQDTLAAVGPQIDALAPELVRWDDLYCLGYGATYAIALEGALKLKEITYAHCEGMLSTEFKHGPLSAVREGYPVIFISGPDDVPLLVSGINETTCRGARSIAIGEEDARLRANAHDLMVLPNSGALINPLLGQEGAPVRETVSDRETGGSRTAGKAGQIDWERAQRLYDHVETISLQVIGFNRGGLLVGGDGLHGFVPISHLLEVQCRNDEQDRESVMAVYVGKPIMLKIIECDTERGRVILSERAALAGTTANTLWTVEPSPQENRK